MKVERAVNVNELRRMARRRLPKMVFDTLDGGADDEISLRRNEKSFSDLMFRPRPLVDVSGRDLSTTMFGEQVTMPLYFSPTGAGRLACQGAELRLARQAGAAGLVYAHSSVASYTPEDIAAAGTGALWYQLYLQPDRGRTEKLIHEVQDAGFRAMVLTIDSPVRGNRERDVRNRFSIPYRPSARLLLQGLSRPGWSAHFVRANLRIGRGGRRAGSPLSLRQVEEAILSATYPVTWDDLSFVRRLWSGPLLIKGLMRSDEVERLIDSGVDGLIVSNHGGRQLDGLPSALDVLPEVTAAARDRLEIYLDGGVRRGSDVVKALALGARACGVGRPHLYAMAAGGDAGLVRLIDILRVEIDRTLALVGCRAVTELDRSFVRPPDGPG